MSLSSPRARLLLAASLLAAWSAHRPADRWIWLFEISLGAAGIAVLAATYRRFRLSNLVYLLAGIHFAILAIGGKYTYAGVPGFDRLVEAGWLERNPFDRIGHLAQGFTPAIIAREVLLRVTPLRRGGWLTLLVVSFCLAFSAFYELLEWGIVVVFYPAAGPEWLGMQGDPWDAQADMLMALIGAVAALAALSRVHDRSIAALGGERR